MVIFIYNDIGLLKEVSGGLHVERWRSRGGGGGVREVYSVLVVYM